MAWKKAPIVNDRGVDIRLEMRDYTRQMHKQLSFMKDLPQRAVLIPCFDHFSAEKALSQWVYPNGTSFPDDDGDLDNALYRALATIQHHYAGATDYSTLKSNYEELLGIFYELVRNTHEWSLKDPLNERFLAPSGRGAFFRLHSGSVKNLSEAAEGHPGLIEFFTRSDDNSATIKHFIELSVYDSGPGFVKRFNKTESLADYTMEAEVDTIRKCLTKGFTSSAGMAHGIKSKGLDKVLRLLNNAKGFLRIRSGRACIYRDLGNDPYQPTKDHVQVILRDWSSGNMDRYRKMPEVEGAVITIVCPLN